MPPDTSFLVPAEKALMLQLFERDYATFAHTARVLHYAALLGDALGLPRPELALLKRGAFVHDVGKIGVPDRVLLKRGRLTPSEYTQMQQHTTKGARIIAVIAPELVPHVRSHHEHYNGRGYPDGLVGEAISLHARIIAIADAYDAMTSDRSYRRGMPPADAQTILCLDAANQWDEHLVAVFLGVLTAHTAVLA